MYAPNLRLSIFISYFYNKGLKPIATKWIEPTALQKPNNKNISINKKSKRIELIKKINHIAYHQGTKAEVSDVTQLNQGEEEKC